MVPANTATVRPASNAEAGRIASMMTLGFADDPGCRRLYPDPEQYLTFFPEFVRLYGGAAFDHGGAHVNDGIGAALWIAPNAHPDGEAIDDLIERSVDAAARPELFEVYAAMSGGHPQEPAWFLPLISVDPFVRGSGLGSALMGNTGWPFATGTEYRPIWIPPTAEIFPSTNASGSNGSARSKSAGTLRSIRCCAAPIDPLDLRTPERTLASLTADQPGMRKGLGCDDGGELGWVRQKHEAVIGISARAMACANR